MLSQEIYFLQDNALPQTAFFTQNLIQELNFDHFYLALQPKPFTFILSIAIFEEGTLTTMTTPN